MLTSTRQRRGRAAFDPQACGDFLRKRHPDKTAAHVAAATGDPARTVERWLAGGVPSLEAFARLARVYGPAFVNATVPGLAWVQHAARLASYDGLNAEIERLAARRDALALDLWEAGS